MEPESSLRRFSKMMGENDVSEYRVLFTRPEKKMTLDGHPAHLHLPKTGFPQKEVNEYIANTKP
jgi:hypothetical protein